MGIINNFGIEFLDYISTSESELLNYQPLGGSFAVIKCKEKYLLCFNTKRKQWELPAGGREVGETPKECAKRELYEETGQVVYDLEFKGVMKVQYNSDNNIKFHPIYFSKLEELQPFKDNNETSDITLWNQIEDLGDMDEVDIKLLDFI